MPQTTLTPKQAALQMLTRLADDATFEQIQYELYVLEKIAEGLASVARGEAVPHHDIATQIARWEQEDTVSNG